MPERHHKRSADRRRVASFLVLAVALLLLQVFCIHLHIHAGLGAAHEGTAAVLHVAGSGLHADHEQDPHELDVTLPAVLKSWQNAKLLLAVLVVLALLAALLARHCAWRRAESVWPPAHARHTLPPLRGPPPSR